MPEGYWIKRMRIGKSEVLALASGERPTFLEKASVERASRMAGFMCKVAANGVPWAMEAGILKSIKGVNSGVAIFELKCRGTTIRVMTYIHDGAGRTPVYLFDIDAHKGADSGLSREIKLKALRLAREAQRCMGNGGIGDDKHNG